MCGHYQKPLTRESKSDKLCSLKIKNYFKEGKGSEKDEKKENLLMAILLMVLQKIGNEC